VRREGGDHSEYNFSFGQMTVASFGNEYNKKIYHLTWAKIKRVEHRRPPTTNNHGN
jgi:hypothetical protein